jgi:hypothetical protein
VGRSANSWRTAQASVAESTVSQVHDATTRCCRSPPAGVRWRHARSRFNGITAAFTVSASCTVVSAPVISTYVASSLKLLRQPRDAQPLLQFLEIVRPSLFVATGEDTRLRANTD